MAIWRKTFAVYQRNACKSITDERGRAGSGENDLCQKKKPFAEHDLRVTLECAGNKQDNTRSCLTALIYSQTISTRTVTPGASPEWNGTDVLKRGPFLIPFLRLKTEK